MNADGYVNANGDMIGFNMYAYCSNNPVIFKDPTGKIIDTIFDIGFISWGICDLIGGGYKDWENWVALGVDIAFAAIPFLPAGSGQIIKIGNKIDNATDIASAINKLDGINDIHKATVIGRNMDRVRDTARLIDKADNLYVPWKGYKIVEKGIGKFLNDSMSMLHDGAWMYGKLRGGYTVIDIGLMTSNRGRRGLWYGIERVVTDVWRTRNIWKLPVNCWS